MDVTPYRQTIACDNYPVQEIGNQAFSARFDGLDDGLTVTNFIDPSARAFSAAAWVKADDLAGLQAILSQENGATWLGLNGSGQLYSTLGGSTHTSSLSTTANTWAHTALSFDGATLSLYLNGQLETTSTLSLSSNSNDLLLGSDGSNFFSGLLDEVVVYNRALADDEIAVLANNNPWQETTLYPKVGLELEDGFNYDWFYREPIPIVEGPYKIDLWAKDSRGQGRYIPSAWSGEIDNIGPSIVLTHTKVSEGIAQISCEASDYNLDDNTWDCPATDDLSYGYNEQGWFEEIFGETDKIQNLSSTSQNALVVGDYTLTACDIYDNCTSYTAFVVDLFEPAGAGIPGSYQSEAHWGDFDNDKDLDILLTGCESKSSCDSPIAQVYANTAGSFSLYASLTGLGQGSSAWGDYDNDGDLDIAIDEAVYENTGSGFVFNPLYTLPNFSLEEDWGDYDNDGDLDKLTGGNNFGYIYQSNNGTLTWAYRLDTGYTKSNAA